MCGTNYQPEWGTACKVTFNDYIPLQQAHNEALKMISTRSHFYLYFQNDGQTTQTVCGMCGVLFDAVYPLGTYSME